MIFVTGGTGLVGAHLLWELAQGSEPIRALYRSAPNLAHVEHIFGYYSQQPAALLARIEWVEGDVLDYHGLEQAMRGCRVVYHAAAMVSFDPTEAARMRYTNQQGTANVVNAALALGIDALAHISSVAALGDAKNGEPVDENSERTKQHKPSAYSESKYLSEMEVWRGVAEGLRAVVVNPSIVIGPGPWGQSSTSLFASVWRGMHFYTSGVGGFVDVRDVAQMTIALVQQKAFGERYLLNAECWPYQQLFEQIAHALGRPAPRYRIGKGTLRLAAWAMRLKKLIFGGPLLLSSETVQSAFRRANYSNRKVLQRLGVAFTPTQQSIEDTARHFLHDKH